MAHARVAFLVGLFGVGCQASAATSAPPAAPESLASSPPASLSESAGQAIDARRDGSFEGAKWGTFHSKRFELSLALPDGSGWKIDDHTSHWLKADHPPTRSTLRVRSWAENQVMTRKDCYARARDWSPNLPEIDEQELVDDRLRRLWGPYDTRVAAGMRAGDATSERGFVVAVAGDLRRCMLVIYETEATGQAAPLAIADRLAFVSDRVLPQVRLDPSFVPPRQPLRGSGPRTER